MSLTVGSGGGPRPKTRARRTRVDRATTVWMIVAAVLLVYTGAFGGQLRREWWLVVHLVALGVITNAILQWSWYFARSLLRLKVDNSHAGTQQTLRLVLFNLALVGLIAAMLAPSVAGAVAAAVVIGAVVIWHLAALILAGRTALGARFAVIIRYYVAAAVVLLIGIIYGAIAVFPLLSPTSPEVLVQMQGDLTIAHSLVNGLGFVGLTIAGTLVTLGPTALRTRMDPGAVARAVQALPFLVVSVLGAVVAATVGALPVAGVFTLSYTIALAWGVGVGLARSVQAKGLKEYPTSNFTLGTLWSMAGLLWLSGALLTSGAGPEAGNAFRDSVRPIVVAIGVGGILQILTGALSYLLPVVAGGGPAAVRGGIAIIEQGSGLRLAARNAALLLVVLAPAAAGPFIAIVGATYLFDIAAFAGAGISQAAAKRSQNEAGTKRSQDETPERSREREHP